MRLRVDLAYDGAPFHGFARQPDLRTVQGVVEDALSRLVGEPVTTTGAGRTDRGVHALAQVVHADLPAVGASADPVVADLDPARLRRRLDRMVGDAITIWAVRPVSGDFDARFSARQRRYRYRLVDDESLDPLLRHAVWHVGEPLSLAAMRRAARHLLGEHDFASFCRARPGAETVRRVDRVAVSRDRSGLVAVAVDGPAFCHQQVRSMVACLVEVGRGRRPPDWVADVLARRDRGAAPAVAPPHGLVLVGVSYGRRWPGAPPPEARAAPRW